ncbi:sensor histidine kinase [Streptomyces sp. NBC_00239]|uniref:sensor histidine kinase n=1 Tax=Streptomyces sp. NBC_00239 TaxID=2903640 RepID=UPI002E29FFF7|nr:histidine kinase [Streptomyces sp. NBC_00239]
MVTPIAATPTIRPHRHDVLIAVSGLLTGLLLWGLGVHENAGRPGLPDRASLLPLAVAAGAALLRRTRPRIALAAGTAALAADLFTVGNLATVLLFTDLVYAAVLYGPPAQARWLPVATGLLSVAATAGALAWLERPEAVLIGVLTALVTFAPALTGASVRHHRDAADAARLRAEQTALLAEMDRTQAVAAERARMARELHDMVAGHLSAIAIHSTAALSIDSPQTSREALGVIRENSVQGLAEMRRLIGLLRDAGGGDPAQGAAVPSLDGLGALLAQAGAGGAASGLEFRLEDARPPGGPLPAPVELAAYRIVQESVTNALKHAAPGRVTVRVERSAGLLTVRVDSPHGRRPGPRAPGSGAGLVGMRERTALLGGVFEAGPAGPGTWRVRASLPADEKGAGA